MQKLTLFCALLLPVSWAQIHQLHPQKAFELFQEGVMMVDVREEGERLESMIADTEFLPLSSFENTFHQLNPSEPVILQCRSGRRSMRAAQILKKAGFLRVYNLEGGILAWEKEGLSVFSPARVLPKTADAILGRLKTALVSSLKSEGIEPTLKMCSLQALELTTKDLPYAMKARRIALKVRNSLNSPDAYEREILDRLTRKPGDILEVNHGKTHFFRSLPTQSLCLSCHGQNIAEPVKRKLEEFYPQDEATGFVEGELRGALHLFMENP